MKWPRQHKWLAFLAIVAVVVLGFFAYEKIALELNRRAFQQANLTIEAIYNDIVNDVSPPDNYLYSRECSQPSRVFGDGPLSCSVATDLIYGVDNKNQADEIKKEIQKVINLNSDILVPAPPPEPTIDITPASGNNTDSSIEYYKTRRGLDCTVKYTFDMPREIGLSVNGSDKKGLGISIGCYAKARAEYY